MLRCKFREVRAGNLCRGRESIARISLTLDTITYYISNAFIVNELASLKVSRLFPLLPDVFHLDGHILGTRTKASDCLNSPNLLS